jgi:predicted ribosomally synthesized peptide with SipW-like signal peptide
MSTPSTSATSPADHGSATAYSWAAAAPRRRRPGRVRALLAGGLVLGVGSAATLASWTDTEWVFGNGGAGGTGGVAAAVFEVQQNVWDGAGGTAQFADRETQAAAGGLTFSPLKARSLSPGDVVHAPMQLRTTTGSVAGTVTLRGAVAAAGSDAGLFGALRYSVRTGVPREACDAAAFAGAGLGTPLTAAGAALTTGSATGALALPAATASAPGTPVDLCFAITLPSGVPDALQGTAASPVWAFDSQSV